MDSSFVADYIEKDAWRSILKDDISLATRNSRDIFAYVFYENTDFNGRSLTVPFLILCNENSGYIQEKIASSSDAFKFHGEVLEMGDFFPAEIGVSNKRIAFKRKSDCFNDRDLVFAGERGDDRFYYGYWGFDGSENWHGRFHAISDLESPYRFDR